MIEKSSYLFNENISGILGLARPRKFVLSPEKKTDKSKLIMEAVTDSSVFTLSFDSLRQPVASDEDTNQPEDNSDVATDPNSIIDSIAGASVDVEPEAPSVKVNKDFFWSTQTTGVRFGLDMKNSFSFPYDDFYASGGSDGVYTILDTAATSLYISNLWFDGFMAELAASAGTKFER